MLDMGWAELLVIAVVVLLAVGPEKLPEVARGLAKLIRQVRRVVAELREVVNLEEFDAQIRQSSRVGEPPPVMRQDTSSHRVVESEAIDLGAAKRETAPAGGVVPVVGLEGQATTVPPVVQEGPLSTPQEVVSSATNGTTTTIEHAK